VQLVLYPREVLYCTIVQYQYSTITLLVLYSTVQLSCHWDKPDVPCNYSTVPRSCTVLYSTVRLLVVQGCTVLSRPEMCSYSTVLWAHGWSAYCNATTVQQRIFSEMMMKGWEKNERMFIHKHVPQCGMKYSRAGARTRSLGLLLPCAYCPVQPSFTHHTVQSCSVWYSTVQYSTVHLL
jgi:hypothetical protein